MEKINVYDFDKTIYKKDCSIEFWRFCLKKKKNLIFLLPYQILIFILYKIKIVTIEKFKEIFFIFIKFINVEDLEKFLSEFWEKEIFNLNSELKYFIKNSKIKNICISASPEFLIKDPCKKLNIDIIIGTNYNLETYKIDGKNCKGKEKVKRLNERLDIYTIENFYSDSLSDLPLFELASNKYLVKKSKITLLK